MPHIAFSCVPLLSVENSVPGSSFPTIPLLFFLNSLGWLSGRAYPVPQMSDYFLLIRYPSVIVKYAGHSTSVGAWWCCLFGWQWFLSVSLASWWAVLPYPGSLFSNHELISNPPHACQPTLETWAQLLHSGFPQKQDPLGWGLDPALSLSG